MMVPNGTVFYILWPINYYDTIKVNVGGIGEDKTRGVIRVLVWPF